MASIVNAGALRNLVLIALAAGVGVTAVYGVAIYGAARAAELRRERRAGLAAAVAALGAAAGLVFAGAIAYGIYLLINRS